MRFLGSIASPRFDVSPLRVVEQAWGGELPEFASQEDAEELIQSLIAGFWNRLSEHQNARSPFRLPRFEVKPSREALLHLAQWRQQELLGFVDGLFGEEEEMDLPERAHDAINMLADIYSMFAGAEPLLADPSKPAEPRTLMDLLRNFQKMTIMADEAINRVIQSCKRARAQHLEALTVIPSRRFTAKQEYEPELIQSTLNQTVTHNGVTVEVHIYKGDSTDWILEVVDSAGNSHVWDDQFATDQAAFDEARRALDEEPLEFTEPAKGSSLN
jgi:hypothetical protein